MHFTVVVFTYRLHLAYVDMASGRRVFIYARLQLHAFYLGIDTHVNARSRSKRT